MIPKKGAAIVFLLVICAAPTAKGVETKKEDSPEKEIFTMNVVAKSRGDEHFLDIALTNTSGKPLTVYKHDLPWEGWDSLVLVAVKTHPLGGSPLDTIHPIDDPGPGKVTIRVGEKLTGRVSLTKHFPSINKALRDRDVIIFWSYELDPVDDTTLKRRLGGYLLIPKVPKK